MGLDFGSMFLNGSFPFMNRNLAGCNKIIFLHLHSWAPMFNLLSLMQYSYSKPK